MSAWIKQIMIAGAVGTAGGALLGLREGSLIFWNQSTHLAGIGDGLGFVAYSLVLYVLIGAALFLVAGAIGGLLASWRWPDASPARLFAAYTGLFCLLVTAMLLGWVKSEWITADIMSSRSALVLLTGVTGAVGVIAWGIIGWPIRHPDGPATGTAVGRAIAVVLLLLLVASVPLARLQALPVTRSAAEETAAMTIGPNVLWVTLCTVRADHLSTYGYERETSPALSRLAAAGVAFDHAVASSCWTRPTHASLFTGAFLSSHGVDSERQRLPAAARTIGEIARQAGYQTVGISNNYNAGTHVGLDRGFDLFVEVWGPLRNQLLVTHWYNAVREERWNIRVNMCSAPETNQILHTWFERHHDPERPFFAFINYAEPHDPYLPPDALARAYLPPEIPLEEAKNYCRAAFIRHGKEVSSAVPLTDRGLTIMQAMYDAELRYQDDALGDLVAELEERDLLDNTVVVVIGDHGEHFGEHGLIGHENSLYEPLLHVPCVLRYPPAVRPGRRDARLVQTTDIMPTTLALMGIDSPELTAQIQGRNLLDGDAPWANVAIAEFNLSNEHAQRMLREDDWKLISPAMSNEELYDLELDPGELHNLVATLAARASRLSSALDGWSETSLALAGEGDEIELEAKALRMLRSLGYVSSD